MKRSLLLVAGVVLVVFGTLLALDNRWTMILPFGAAAMCLGLARSVTAPTDEASKAPHRVAAAEIEDVATAINEPIEAPVSETAAPFVDEPVAEVVDAKPKIVAVPQPVIDPVDAELQSLIDEDQMQEINELVAAADVADGAADAVDTARSTELVPGRESVEPLARLELRLADYNDDDLKRVVKESESVVIAEMVRSGQLTSEGELTQQDIASMIFLAYTSEEMLTELRLRKSLESTPGQTGLEASTGSDFAPLKNIE